MSQRYTREQLEGLRRADLQKIGKVYIYALFVKQ